jgi:polyhydroxyalkanoate synthesis regulator protein
MEPQPETQMLLWSPITKFLLQLCHYYINKTNKTVTSLLEQAFQTRQSQF